VGEQEAMVVYDLTEGFDLFEELACSAVDRVTTVEALSHFQAAYLAVFDNDCSDTVARLAEAIQTGGSGHDAYLAYADGVPASVGRLYTNPQGSFAGLYGGETLPNYRGKGLYRAIVAARARDALNAGVRYLLVDAMPTSLPILLRLGFSALPKAGLAHST
jgi:GNAT superfamily N-acetyltransferase